MSQTPGGRARPAGQGTQQDDAGTHHRPPRGRWLAGAVVVAAIVAVVAGLAAFRFGGGAPHAGGRPPATVTATTAQKTKWQPALSSVGTLRADQQVQIAAQVGGVVRQVDFSSGDRVKQGDTLVAQDVQQDQEKLKGLLADLDLAQAQFKRSKRLAGKDYAAQSQLDQRRAALEKAKASVDEQRTLIAKKHITAPFAGRLGLRRIDPGAYLAPGQSFVTLQKIDPLKLDFALPQRDLGELKLGQTVELTVDAYPKNSFKGQITAIDPQVDTGTRSVQVEARVDNSDRRLAPGMFADVSILTRGPVERVTLPRTAISYNPYGDYVYVIGPSGDKAGGGNGGGKAGNKAPTVKQVFVQVGRQRGEQVAITKGLKVGQRVVTSGQQKLYEGAAVRVDNAQQPGDSAHVTPGNS